MRSVYAVLIVINFASSSYINYESRPDEGAEWSDTRLDTVSLIHKYKYPAELHRVTTQDGYILTLHRIPYGRLCPQELSKGPIILQHGLFSSSTHFILPGTKNGLGYILADACYDVWMPNSRGNSHSLGHVKYTTKDYEYWDFSWHEMGLYDQPAVFDYILEWTGAENLTYVGHSQGTTSFLVFSIFHPEYESRVRAAYLLAPIAYLGHTSSITLQVLSKFYLPLKVLADSFGVYNVVQQNDLISNLTDVFCTSFRPLNPIICENVIFLTIGFDSKATNLTFFTLLLGNEFYGSSIKQLVHYAQLIDSDKFREYDYGLANDKTYGQSTPPDYDLSRVSAPVHLYYSANDYLADVKDVVRLANQLPNVQEQYLIPFEKFNHLDHLFAENVAKVEYERLVESIDRYY